VVRGEDEEHNVNTIPWRGPPAAVHLQQSEQDTGDSDETASEVTSVQQKMEMAMRQSLDAAAPCQSSSSQDTDKKLDASIKAEMANEDAA